MSKWDIPADVKKYKNNLASIRDKKNMQYPVVAFGDSVTESAGCAFEQRWTTLLEGRLDRTVINAGIGGTTSAFGLWRIERDVLSLKPAVVIMNFLLNDGHIAGWETTESYFPKMSPEYSLQCVRQIVKLCRKNGTAPIIWTANPIGKNYPLDMKSCPMQKDFHKIQMIRYEYFLKLLLDLCARDKVPVAQTYQAFIEHGNYTDLLMADHIHPNDQAQPLIASILFDQCKSLI